MPHRKHIAFVNSWYPSRVSPTNGDFIQRHAEAVALLHDVSALHVVTDPALDRRVEFVHRDVNGVNTWIAYIAPTRNPIWKVWRFWKAYRKLFKEIGKPDLLHVNRTFPAGIIAVFYRLFFNIPYLITEHWTGYHPDRQASISLIERRCAMFITSLAAFVCPVSEHLGQSMRSLGFKGRYHPVPNVVKTAVFHPDSSSPSSDIFTVLHVSNMVDSHKNITGLLEGLAQFMKRNNKVHLQLIGDNPQRYIPFVNEMDIDLDRCAFIDQLPQEELAEYMRHADVFVLFSNKENLPCVILESFASGTPVISTRVGGIEEYFPSDYGILIPKGDIEALNIALEEVYKNKGRLATAESMFAYARNHFSPMAIARSFDKLYRIAGEG